MQYLAKSCWIILSIFLSIVLVQAEFYQLRNGGQRVTVLDHTDNTDIIVSAQGSDSYGWWAFDTGEVRRMKKIRNDGSGSYAYVETVSKDAQVKTNHNRATTWDIVRGDDGAIIYTTDHSLVWTVVTRQGQPDAILLQPLEGAGSDKQKFLLKRD